MSQSVMVDSSPSPISSFYFGGGIATYLHTEAQYFLYPTWCGSPMRDREGRLRDAAVVKKYFLGFVAAIRDALPCGIP